MIKGQIELRQLLRQIFDQVRRGERNIAGRSAQKKLEKTYRRELWETADGKQLEAKFPDLPGQVRVMIPKIQSIAKSNREFTLLLELAKSARTRNLIGSVLTREVDIEDRVYSLYRREKQPALKKRLEQTLRRFERAVDIDNQISNKVPKGIRQILLNIRYVGMALSTIFVANARSSSAAASRTRSK